MKKKFKYTTIINYPNTGGYLLQQWVIKCNDKINNGKKIFSKKTQTSSPVSHSGATILPITGDSFKYIETSSGNSGSDNFYEAGKEQILFKLPI